ncbi:hypothetical protein KR009_000142, partial [Drosophila setifemur]
FSLVILFSQGCFVYKNGATRATKKTPVKRKRVLTSSSSSLLDQEIICQPFYEAYRQTWSQVNAHIAELQQRSYARTVEHLVNFVAMAKPDELLPTAALLTGINQPDHLSQFDALTRRLHDQQAARVCVLLSRDCSTLKAAVEAMVFGLVEYDAGKIIGVGSGEEEEEHDVVERDHKRLRRSQCTLKQLRSWYENNFPSGHEREQKRRQLVVILPDFEGFSASVLQDFILILSAHSVAMPFVLILGVATAMSAVHGTLPYHVSSKIRLRVFQTQAAPTGLNEVLDKVLLSPRYAFHLSGKTFKFLTHIFLYYDFSVHGFIQGFKYCLMEHFSAGNAFSLCSDYGRALGRIKQLTHIDIECIRRLPSFRQYVEGINDCKRVISVLTDDEYLKKKLPQLLRDCHIHFILFRCALEFLTDLVGDLPHCPLGKLRRELYAHCLNKTLVTSPEFKECWQMLSFLARDEFVAKVKRSLARTEEFLVENVAPLELGQACIALLEPQLKTIYQALNDVFQASMTAKTDKTSPSSTYISQISSRQELKAQILQRSKDDKHRQEENIPTTEFARAVQKTLKLVETHLVQVYLRPLQDAPPIHELFVFDDIATVRRNIIGAPRAALHSALNNPHFYLQCKCCELRDQTHLVGTLPDLTVAYKLHLECGRMINLFDWLQAFQSVLNGGDNVTDDAALEQIDPRIQACFTRAVAELQFLGYIKTSKRKTDHVTRLTW